MNLLMAIQYPIKRTCFLGISQTLYFPIIILYYNCIDLKYCNFMYSFISLKL